MTKKETFQDAYQALTNLIQDNQQSFYRLSYQYVKNVDTAMDLIQEAIVKAYSKLHTIKDISSIKPWFYRILVNENLGYLRKNKHIIITEQLPEDTISTSTDLAENIDLYQAIGSLSEELKTIIVLRFFEDMKLEDIALITHTNINTVKTRLYRALKQLKPLMQETMYL